MIENILIQNFKSYKRANLPLAPLTLLIGANASGKSNAIEAIRFISWLAHGQRLEDIVDRVQQSDISIRGTINDIIHDNAGVDCIAFGCSLPLIDDWKDFYIEIKLQDSGRGMRVVKEHIKSSSTIVPLYEIKNNADSYSHEVQVAYNNFARGGKKPVIPCSDRQAIFTQLDVPSRFDGPAKKQIPKIVTKLQDKLKDIVFLDPNPRAMADYSFIIDNKLRGDGANLSSTLFEICETQKRKDEVLEFIRSLPEQDIADISFLRTPRNEVMVQLVETFANSNKNREAPLLSDGTLRVLSIAAALLSAADGSFVIIEEIDNGVHPSRARILLENILKIAKKRNLRVLLTSHNPALLDALPKESIPNIVCCYRDPDEGDSRLTRLQDLLEYPELIARGPVGHLMTKGILDEYLKKKENLKEKNQLGLGWIKMLQKDFEGI